MKEVVLLFLFTISKNGNGSEFPIFIKESTPYRAAVEMLEFISSNRYIFSFKKAFCYCYAKVFSANIAVSIYNRGIKFNRLWFDEIKFTRTKSFLDSSLYF